MSLNISLSHSRSLLNMVTVLRRLRNCRDIIIIIIIIIRKLGYGFLFAFRSNYGLILYHF